MIWKSLFFSTFNIFLLLVINLQILLEGDIYTQNIFKGILFTSNCEFKIFSTSLYFILSTLT